MSAPGRPQHVCFYSNGCRWSKGFIEALKQTDFIGEFSFVCVDGKIKEMTQRYPFLKKTPTLVIRGEDEPRTDGQVMNYVSERRLMSKSGGDGQGESQGGGSQEPEPWVGGEMGGSYTKSFSFVNDTENDTRLMGNFDFLNGGNSMATRTASDMPGGGLGSRAQKTKKEELFDKQMESYMQQRSQGMPQTPMRS